MDEQEEIAKALKARLSELRTHLAKVVRELHKPLPADSEDQAVELENQEALEGIEMTETTEIHQIEAALKRISEGIYGTCAKCGEPIDPRRLKALPTAATCISCSERRSSGTAPTVLSAGMAETSLTCACNSARVVDLNQ